MFWNNVTGTPTFNGGQHAHIYGDLVINSAMNYSQTGQLHLYGSATVNSAVTWNHPNWTYFKSDTTGNTVDMGGNTFNYHVQFSNTTGEWTLENDLTIHPSYELQVVSGTFISGGYEIDAGYEFDAYHNAVRHLDFTGTDTVRMGREWRMYPNPGSSTLETGGATILIESSANSDFHVYGGGFSYDDFVVNHNYSNHRSIHFHDNNQYGNVTINPFERKTINFNGSSTYNSVLLTFTSDDNISEVNVNAENSFNNFTLLSQGILGPEVYFDQENTFNSFVVAGQGTRVFLASGKTQTTNSMSMLGVGGFPLFLFATDVADQATVFQASGEICLDFVWLAGIDAEGGATFNAGSSSRDLGNNSDWGFHSCSGYYWVGNTGVWSDPFHWATSSGGTEFHLVPPTQFDNVYFDANSFTAPGQTVHIDIADPRCRDMSWSSPFFAPTFTGISDDIDIYGSLDIISAMNMNYTGDFRFMSNDTGHVINAGGHTLQNVKFVGPGNGFDNAEWTLTNDLAVADSLIIGRGSLFTNGRTVRTKYLHIDPETADTVNMDLGASEIYINNGSWEVAGNNVFNLSPGSSCLLYTSPSPRD